MYNILYLQYNFVTIFTYKLYIHLQSQQILNVNFIIENIIRSY